MTLLGTVPPPPSAPAPPPGPGVQPPFVVPPTDGTAARRWIASGVAAGIVVLLCTAGVAVLIVMNVLILQAARSSAEQYLGALRDGSYDRAYGLLCDQLQARLTPTQLAQRNQPPVVGFAVGDADLAGDEIYVPATVDYADGTRASVEFLMVQDPETGGFSVCSLDR